MQRPVRACGIRRSLGLARPGVAAVVLAIAALWHAGASAYQLRLTWVDSATDETGFSIERRGAGEATFAEIAVVAANTTSYVDAGLAEHASYCYRVTAFNDVGRSASSNEACGTVRATEIVAAVLPSSRAVQPGSVATVFGTILNAGVGPAVACEVAGTAGVAVTVTYQATDPSTSQFVAAPGVPVDIVPGGARTYVIELAPTDTFGPTELALRFQCQNTGPAPVVAGVNTLLLWAPGTPSADVVAVAATLDNDGIVKVSGPTGTGVFAVGSSNVGETATVTVEVDTGSARLPMTATVCETRPGMGDCLAPPTHAVSVDYEGGTARSFAIFVAARGPIAFNPAGSRVFVRFRDAGGATRGAASVAVRTRP